MSRDVEAVSRHVATLLRVLGRFDAVVREALARRRDAVTRPDPADAAPRRLLVLEDEPADSRFRQLAEAFALSQLELDLFLLALAPELDARYCDLFAVLQEDPDRCRPTVSAALDLLGLTPAQRLAVRHFLGPAAPLVRFGLVRLPDPPGAAGSPLPERLLTVDERLVGFVTGDDALDDALTAWADVVPVDGGAPLAVSRALRARLDAVGSARPALCHLRGSEGAGRQGAAEELAGMWGCPVLLRVRTDRLPMEDPLAFAAAVTALGREARLRGAALFWERADPLLTDGREPLRALLRAELAGHRHSFVSSQSAWPAGDRPVLAEVAVPSLDTTQRCLLWRRALDGKAAGETELAALAAAFRLGPAAIAAAAAEVATLPGPVPATGLAAAARRQGSAALVGVAQLVEQPFDWGDLVLPADRLQRLRALSDRIRHRALVHDAWGFAAKLGPARGVAALFTGPSGTGKTMAAGVLAADLGLELYRVDLSVVLSKYIGETEKNLARVFAAAEAVDAVLFFDEADALFGKRTEVRDAHDRYANLEVAYLLQRIEEHDGVVVLATNLRKNVDEAFLRRLQFVVEFPMPDRDHRRLIWEQVWPAAAPLDPALDLDLLADRFELSGGSIRNVAVEAAFAAAAGGSAIGPEHVRSALRNEHLKLGRVAADRAWAEPARDGEPLAWSAG